MQVENFSKYQSWVEAEMECAKGVRKRKQKVFWKCIAITVVVAVVVGFYRLSAGCQLGHGGRCDCSGSSYVCGSFDYADFVFQYAPRIFERQIR